MDIDRRTIVAFLLMGLILIFMQTDIYKKWLYPGGAPTRKSAVPDTTARAESTVVAGTPKVVGTGTSEETTPVAVPELRLKALPERHIVVESPLYVGEFSTRGARIVSWKMKQYLRPDSQAVELVGLPGANNLGLRFVVGEDTLDSQDWNFACEAPDTIRLEDGAADSIRFWTELNGGRRVEKVVRLRGGSYDIEVDVRLSGWADIVADKSYRLVWAGGMWSSEARLADDAGYTKAYALLGKSLEKFDVGRARAKRQSIPGITHWVSGRTKYFTVSLIPLTEPGDAAEFHGWKVPVGGGEWKLYDFGIRMPLVGETVEHSFRVYLGPLDYFVVRGYGVGLERMMDFGWSLIRPISKGILLLFRWFHRFIPNYGVVLILFSILVKIAVFPLTRKSYVSMKQMQMLQPRLAELKEKYGKDPQRLNRETMKLYKEYGVNPLSGCLPMLLQFPLLYALFIVFRSTIELRGAKFVWWIKDLSQPDTVAQLPFSLPLYGDSVNVLPLVMGATMLVQQKMSVTDPKQKAMVYLMPIFFMLLFNNFPSGLNLYYTLFNVLTIIQQKMIPEGEVALKPKEKGAKGRRLARKF